MKHLLLLMVFLFAGVNGFANEIPNNADKNMNNTAATYFLNAVNTDIFTEDFELSTSVDGWTLAADASTKPSEVTFEWAEFFGVSSSNAMRFGGVNTEQGVGRAYIAEKVFTNIDFGGATDVTFTVAIKSEGLTGTGLTILTDIAGSVQQNTAAHTEINESDFTVLTFTHTGISASANSAKILINVAAGAEPNFGGTILIDDIKVTSSGGGSSDGNLLTNGDFEAGDDDSWYTNFGDNNPEIRTEGGNSFFFAEVMTAGAAFVVNMSQLVTITPSADYVLTFDASTGAGTTRTMIAGIGESAGAFRSAAETVTLTENTQTFTLPLQAVNDSDGAPFGDATSRVLFDMGADVGVVVIDNVSLVAGEVVTLPEPAASAPTPPARNAEDVISVFSDAYTDVAVASFATDWSQGSSVADFSISDDNIKEYSIVAFVGLELAGVADLSEFTHMYVDFWVGDEAQVGQVFNMKLSNHGNGAGNGETNAIQYTHPVTTTRDWVSLDIPLGDFVSADVSESLARDNVLQLVITTPGITNIFLDNIYFYKGNGVSTDLDEVPAGFALEQNYPNPFNPSTNISYSIPVSGEVSLEVFNLQGQKVMTLFEGYQSAGAHNAVFDASNLASGVYVYRLVAGTNVQVRKMMLIK